MLRLQSDRKDLDIWLRLEGLYHFYWNDERGKIEFDMYHDFCCNTQLSRLKRSKPLILLYVVSEGEKLQTDTYDFPMLISTSIRDFSEDFKAIWKSMGTLLRGRI